MHFILFLTFDGIRWGIYGPCADHPYETNKKIRYYQLSNDWSDVDLFDDDHDIDEIAERCNSLISYGDADFFDAKKCRTIVNWVNERLKMPAAPRYREMLEVLRDFCNCAVELNTGVEIDF